MPPRAATRPKTCSARITARSAPMSSMRCRAPRCCGNSSAACAAGFRLCWRCTAPGCCWTTCRKRCPTAATSARCRPACWNGCIPRATRGASRSRWGMCSAGCSCWLPALRCLHCRSPTRMTRIRLPARCWASCFTFHLCRFACAAIAAAPRAVPHPPARRARAACRPVRGVLAAPHAAGLIIKKAPRVFHAGRFAVLFSLIPPPAGAAWSPPR